MRKTALVVLLGLTVGSVRAADVLQIDSTNMVGMTCFNSSLAELPIGVVYGDYATTNVEMGVTNLLWTGNLQTGDMLHIYDYEQDCYRSLMLTGGSWIALDVDVDGGGAPIDVDKDVFKYGRGAWLFRQDIDNRPDKNVYTFGQVPVGQITVRIEPGKDTFATSTLISSPISEPLDLNGGAIDWTSVALDRDVIRVPQENGRMKDYSWDSNEKKWYIISGFKVVTTGLVIPRGLGFWYSRAAGNTEGATLIWNVGNH